MSNEILWFIMLILNFASILVVYRFFGKTGLFCWIPIACILANIQVLKLVEIFGITATLGNIIYASSFLVTDILSENYGKETARRAILLGFISLVAMTVFMNLALYFTPAEGDFAQSSLSAIFSLMPRITLASFTAYLVSQLHDVWAYGFWKKKKPDVKYIWIRNNLSTLVSQLIDTLIFTFIAFWGSLTGSLFLEVLVTTYIFKLITALCDTPLVYIAGSWYRQSKVKE
ncbi:MAG: queuosine precursor transporter [Spirochaetales bacterium]|nr:queuosine precursor transporter [Spirochaetales bacterium]